MARVELIPLAKELVWFNGTQTAAYVWASDELGLIVRYRWDKELGEYVFWLDSGHIEFKERKKT